ncbi:MAG: PIF1 family DEAD/DEAH box helicase [Candidatus Andersenbacteria bacterium]|nr:PIF1 family DEAD/DEAH box helicase [bacterium]MDZ4225262.1 PIF1 family DEAD/DEAH box helicase [Candidatus Andersenbacteria bacterium]
MTQQEAFVILKTGACVFLTGEPGSGKTHTIRQYVDYLKRAKIETAVTASTGIAATHIGGVTIHSWSGIGIKKNISEYDLDRLASNERLSKRIVRTKVLIIDEISMLDADTLDSVERMCRAVKANKEPFGGLQVVLVGDFFQLPPVAKFNEPPARYAFAAAAWARANFLPCYLAEQWRQDDQSFLEILAAMRRNAVAAEHRLCLDKRCVSAPVDGRVSITKLFTHNADVDRINEERLKQVSGEAKTFTMQATGKKFLVEQLKRNCLSPDQLRLKKGAVVMFTKNSPKREFVNGTLGKVVDWQPGSNWPVVKTFGGKLINTETADWAIEDNGRVLARVAQIPLRLAWAITVHKSQGMSLDAAYIDLRDAFVEGQGYVALSRLRSLKGLFLAGYNEQSLRVHRQVLEGDAGFREQSEEAAAVFGRMPATEISKMHQNFIRAMGGKLTKNKGSAASGKVYSVELVRQKYPNAYRPWSEADDSRLTELYKEGKGVKDLAEVFGRKRGAIRARLEKIGLITDL